MQVREFRVYVNRLGLLYQFYLSDIKYKGYIF